MGKLNNLYRYNISLIKNLNKNEAIVFLTNLILGFDSAYYFERYGLAMTNTPFNNSITTIIYKNYMKDAFIQGKISNNTIIKKFWYADNNQYNYSLNNGSGCYEKNNKYEINIVNITKDISTGKYNNISLPFIDYIGHLVFEIIENETVIGFTNNLFDKIKYPVDYIPRYRIVAYDRLLNFQESNLERTIKNI